MECYDNRVLEMQQNMDQIEEELKKTKGQLAAAEEERDEALDELKEMKKIAQEANMNLSEAVPTRKVSEVYTELNAMKVSLTKSSQDLKIKEKTIENLKRELEKAKHFESKLVEKNTSLAKLEEDLKIVKNSSKHALDSLTEARKRVEELEIELQNEKKSAKKMSDSLVLQAKEFNQTKNLLEQLKLENNNLRQKVGKYEASSGNFLLKEALESLNSELQLAKQNLVSSQENEKIATTKAQNLLGEMTLLKNELKRSTEAEATSKKAMEDLTLALTEISTESNRAKENLVLIQDELEEARKEAEESLLAWNGKELGFVGCIKKAEEETFDSQQENSILRDILKQALNEANAAKEAAGIAKTENSQLKDFVDSLTQEIEILTIAKAQAQENIKELNKMLFCVPANELKSLEKGQKSKLHVKKTGKAFSFDLNDLKFPFIHHHKHKDSKVEHESPKSISNHRRKTSAIFNDDGETVNLDDFSGESHVEDIENVSRKKKALIRRLSDLLRMRSIHKKEETI